MHEFPRRKSSDNGDHYVKPPLAEARGFHGAFDPPHFLPRLDYRRAELPRFLVGAMHHRLISFACAQFCAYTTRRIETGSRIACAKTPPTTNAKRENKRKQVRLKFSPSHTWTARSD
jgi:hypothetical protein